MNEMYDSFDVLISASKYETFGLVVAEALSAGIPCLLADIPTFRSLYSDCEGVILLTGDHEQDIKNINYLLKNAVELKKPIIQFWEDRFSSEIVQELWFERILKISAE